VEIMQRNGALFSVTLGPPVVVAARSQNLPGLVTDGEGGVLDAVADPRIVNNDAILVSYTATGATGTKLVVVRGGGDHWTTVFETPEMPGNVRFGGRLAFTVTTPAESNRTVLLISVGDRGRSDLAQDKGSYFGKTVRVNFDQPTPIASNPFVGVPGAKPEIWTLGHRDPIFAASSAFASNSIAIDRGAAPGGGDVVQYIQRGCTYAWPNAVPDSPSPLFVWATPVRPLTMYFYDGTSTESANGDLLVGAENYSGVIQLRWGGTSFTETNRFVLPHPLQKIRRFRGSLHGLEVGHSGRLVRLDPSY